MKRLLRRNKTVVFLFFILVACGIPNDTVVFDPPVVGNRIETGRLIGDFQNQNSEGQFYQPELKGFNFYYRFFNPNSTTDANYIPTSSTLDGDLIDRLTALGEQNLTLSTVNTLANTDTLNGYNGFFKFFSKNDGGITLLIDTLNLEKRLTFSFNFQITDNEMDSPYIEYDAYISDTATEQRRIYLYRNIFSTTEPSTARLRTFDESATDYINTHRYSFLPSDKDLQGANSVADKSNTQYYIGIWCLAQGVTTQLETRVSEPSFLGMREINIEFASIDESADVIFADNYMNYFE